MSHTATGRNAINWSIINTIRDVLALRRCNEGHKRVCYLSHKRLKQVSAPSSVWAVFHGGGSPCTA